MTKEHLVEILIRLKNAYPLFYSNRANNDLSPVAQIWYEHLGQHDEKIIDKAVFLMIDNETEVPTIALVNRYIPKAKEILQQEKQKNDVELQSRIRRLSK